MLQKALAVSLVLLAALPTLAADEVRVLRGRRVLTGLSSTGMGGSIEKLDLEVDLSVANLSYDKVVGIRYSTDEGKTFVEANGYWVETFEDGREHWRVATNAGTVGRNVLSGGARADMGPAFVRYSAFFKANGQTYTDGATRSHAIAVLAPSIEPLPELRAAPKTALVGDELFLVGGQSNGAYNMTVPSVLKLETRTGRWTKVADFPQIPPPWPGAPLDPSLLFHFETFVVGSSIHVVGGEIIKVGGRPLENMALDTKTGTWTQKAALPGGLEGRRAVVKGDEVHLVRTNRSPGHVASDEKVYVYATKTDTWTTAPVAGIDLLVANDYACEAAAGKLFYFGADTLSYDPAARRIERLPASPFPIVGLPLVAALDASRIVLANANADFANDRSDVLVFDALARSFTKVANGPLLAWSSKLATAPSVRISDSGSPARTVSTLLVLNGTRVDTFEPFTNALTRASARTIFKVQADVGWGHRVTIRGSASPLGWTLGVEATWTSGNVWVFETTELLGPRVRWKPLVDDQRWRSGEDLTVSAGETTVVSGAN